MQDQTIVIDENGIESMGRPKKNSIGTFIGTWDGLAMCANGRAVLKKKVSSGTKNVRGNALKT